MSYRSAVELAFQIRHRDRSPVDVVEACLERIDERNDGCNAFVTVTAEHARDRAREAERAVENGDALGPLHGVPVGIKDLVPVANVRTTFGSKPLAEYVPTDSATEVTRLEAAGAIVVGKTNTPEFGHKGTTDNGLFGPTSTPFDPDRNAGGSSGGSAAAVADGMVPIATGTDGGGSIRIPAAWCGVYGFKPTYGLVPQSTRPDAFLSHTPFIFSGPLTRTVEDAALMTAMMAGYDERDPLSVPNTDPPLLEAVRSGVGGLRIGYVPEFDVFPVEPRVREVVDDAVFAFEEAGASVEEVELSIDTTQNELSSLWLRQIGMLYQSQVEGFADQGIDLVGDHRDELTPAFVDLLDRTRDISVSAYKRDDHVRTKIYDAISSALESYDLLVTPTLATGPVENASEGSTVGATDVAGESVDPLIGWCLTYPLNFTGHPAASIPAGFDEDGLPVGMQLVGDRFDDETVITASAVFERLRPWGDTYPA
ncbi:amidase [Natrarchaeobius sp. A-rgal3]|uniref:amidase n=1 Tax=Natrarchaeobius versutus TaxID=1679078 RepID=UPI00351064E6